MTSITSLTSGYTLDTVIDELDHQAIIVAKKIKDVKQAKPTRKNSSRVLLKIGLKKDTMRSLKREYKILKGIKHDHIIAPLEYSGGKC